jgi:hydroxyacylglutathione hydrolase
MILERIFDELLAQASYLIGCEETKTAIVIDPNRDVDQYVELAAAKKLTITHVTETHIHADFVSGARELARRTKAELILSGSGGRDWQYAFAGDADARIVRHSDTIDVGTVHITVRETPGHTPEHICFLVTDRTLSDRPVGMATGDFIFAGDVGRPDLLEKAANVEGASQVLAKALFQSIRATRNLPDYLQLWPGHGAGSACGKSLGAMPSTTLGFERVANWAFQIEEEAAFVAEALAGQPEPPAYFARMKQLNRDDPPTAPALKTLPRLDVGALETALGDGTAVIDVRSSADFAAGHIPSTLSVPLGTSLPKWAGTLLSYDQDIVLLADTADRIRRARHALMLIGMDRVVGQGGKPLRTAWAKAHGPLATVTRLEMQDLSSADGRTIVDVRGVAEFRDGHVPGSVHHYLGDLAESMQSASRDQPIALYCKSGTRASIAASILQAQGFTDVAVAPGGIDAWEATGKPVERSAE